MPPPTPPPGFTLSTPPRPPAPPPGFELTTTSAPPAPPPGFTLSNGAARINTAAATPPAPPPGFELASPGLGDELGDRPWIQVPEQPLTPDEITTLPESLLQTAQEWGDVFAGLPTKVRASVAGTIANLEAMSAGGRALYAQQELERAEQGPSRFFQMLDEGKTPEELAAVNERRAQSVQLLEQMKARELERLGEAQAITAETGADLQPTPGANIGQRALEQAAISAPPSAVALATGLLTRNPALAAATMQPTSAASGFGDILGELDARARQQELETLRPQTEEERFADIERALKGGAVEGDIEFLTEVLPFGKLLKAGSPAIEKLAEVLLAELPGETLATLTQEINRQIALQPEGEATLDAVFAGLEEGGKQIPETLVSTILGSAGQTAPVAAAEYVASRRKTRQETPPAPPGEGQPEAAAADVDVEAQARAQFGDELETARAPEARKPSEAWRADPDAGEGLPFAFLGETPEEAAGYLIENGDKIQAVTAAGDVVGEFDGPDQAALALEDAIGAVQTSAPAGGFGDELAELGGAPVPQEPAAGEISAPAYTVPPAAPQLAAAPSQEGAGVATGGAGYAGVERRTTPRARKPVAQMNEAELRQQLLTHELTGIPNRRAYEEAPKLASQTAVDVDSLKWVNDNMGHDAGNELLKAVGEAIRAETDQAYHLSGDEFAIQSATPEEAAAIMQRVNDRLAGAVISVTMPDGKVVTVSGLGVSYGSGKDLGEADAALQAHKTERQARGERAGRGEQPPGASRVSAETGRQDHEGAAPAEEQPAEDLGADTAGIDVQEQTGEHVTLAGPFAHRERAPAAEDRELDEEGVDRQLGDELDQQPDVDVDLGTGPGGMRRKPTSTTQNLEVSVRRMLLGARNAPKYRFVKGDGLPADVQSRMRLPPGHEWRAAFDPVTHRVWFNEDTIDSPEAAAWYAMHEIAGHYGIKGAIGQLGAPDRTRINQALNLVAQNPYIDGLAVAYQSTREGMTYAQALEEALAELAAAIRTRNFARLERLYGLKVPGTYQGKTDTGPKPAWQRAFEKFVSTLQRIFERLMGYKVTDQQVLELLEGAWRYVQTGEQMQKGPRVDKGGRDRVDLADEVDKSGRDVEAILNADTKPAKAQFEKMIATVVGILERVEQKDISEDFGAELQQQLREASVLNLEKLLEQYADRFGTDYDGPNAEKAMAFLRADDEAIARRAADRGFEQLKGGKIPRPKDQVYAIELRVERGPDNKAKGIKPRLLDEGPFDTMEEAQKFLDAEVGEGYRARVVPIKRFEFEQTISDQYEDEQESGEPPDDTVREPPPVSVRRGEEDMRKYGLGEGANTTRQVAAALEKRQIALHRKIDATDYTPKTRRRIARWMAAEIEHELQNPRDSGVGWYGPKFKRALRELGKLFPELNTNKPKRDLMTALIAITSSGVPVQHNLERAIQIYRGYRETGKLTVGRNMRDVAPQLANLTRLIEALGGLQGAQRFLMKELTVSELKKRAAQAGVDFNVEVQADQRMPMAALVFGPKLGAFYANLMGADGYLTMDRWWSRTFNRYRGQLITKPNATGLARFRTLIGKPGISDNATIEATIAPRNSYAAKGYKNGTEIEKAANTLYKAAFELIEDTPRNARDRTFMLETAKEAQAELKRRGHDVSIADIQAILWYYEKRLYGELGARQSKVVSYEDAAKRVVAEATRAGRDRRGRSDLEEAAGAAPGREAADDVPGDDDAVREGGKHRLITQAIASRFAEGVKIELGLDEFRLFLEPNGDIELGAIAVEPKDRKKGLGTRAMRKLTAWADKNGVRLVLSVAQPEDGWGTTSSARLERFYGRFGFVKNTGRKADYTISQGMYRPIGARGAGDVVNEPALPPDHLVRKGPAKIDVDFEPREGGPRRRARPTRSPRRLEPEQGELFTKDDARPGTNAKQLALANELLREWAERAAKGTKAVKTLVAAFDKDFRTDHSASLLGRNLTNAHEFALLAQTFRDPRYETLRYFFTDKAGNVIAETGVSARLPGGAQAWPAGASAQWLLDMYQRTKAEGIRLLHNHPSGSAQWSEADLSITRRIAMLLKIPLEHVIVDSNEYSVIRTNADGSDAGSEARVKLTELGPDKMLKPKGQRKLKPLIGRPAWGPRDVVQIAQMLGAKKNFFSLIGLSARHDVRAIGDLRINAIKNIASLEAALHDFGLQTGSPSLILAGLQGNELMVNRSTFVKLIQDGYLLDVVDVEGRSLAEIEPQAMRTGKVLGRIEHLATEELGSAKPFGLESQRGTEERGDRRRPAPERIENKAQRELELEAAQRDLDELIDPHTTETSAFKRWFGRSVVTVNGKPGGKPLVVYHGTKAKTDFDAFTETSDIGFHFGTAKAAADRLGFWEGGKWKSAASQRARVIPVYLSIKNPLRLPDLHEWSTYELAPELLKAGIITAAQAKAMIDDATSGVAAGDMALLDVAEFRRLLEAKGYDGVVYKNEAEGVELEPFPFTIDDVEIRKQPEKAHTWNAYSPEGDFLTSASTEAFLMEKLEDLLEHGRTVEKDSWIALRPTQIKSAIGNRGTFSEEDEQIQLASGKKGGSSKSGFSGGPGQRYVEMYRYKNAPGAPTRAKLREGELEIPAEPIRAQHVMELFQRLFKVKIYEGKPFKVRSALGFFRPSNFEVRNKYRNDLEVAAHEVFHWLDRTYPAIRKLYHQRRFADELKGVSYDETKLHEGFAEFGRLFMTQEPEAIERLPTFYEAFVGAARDEGILDKLEQVQKLMHQWYLQGAEARGRSKIGTSKAPIAQRLQKMADGFIDRAIASSLDARQAAKVIERETLGEKAFGDAAYSPYKSIRLLGGLRSTINTWLNYGTLKWTDKGDLERNGIGLKQIFEPIADVFDEAMGYFVALRADELRVHSKENLFTKDETKALIERARKTGKLEQIQKAHEQYQLYTKRLLSFAVQSGILNSATRDTWEELYANYVPFYRVAEKFGTLDPKMAGGTQGGLFRRLTGGTANVADVFENITLNTALIVSASMKNMAMRQLFAAIESSPVGQRYAVRIGDDTEQRKVGIDQIRRVLDEFAKAAADKYHETDEADEATRMEYGQMAMLARRLARRDPDKGQLTMGDVMQQARFFFTGRPPQIPDKQMVLVRGEPRWFQIGDPLLWDMLTDLNYHQPLGLAEKIFGMAKRTLTRGVTLSPEFQIANMLRDTFNAFAMSKGGQVPIVDALKAIRDIWKESPDYVDFLANGGGFGNATGDEAKRLRVRIHASGHRWLSTPAELLDYWDKWGQSFELATRLAEYKRIRAKGGTRREAAFEGREISTDFSMRGHSQLARFASISLPFFNARLQGLYRIEREINERRGRQSPLRGERALNYAMKAFTGLTIPSLLIYWFLNRGDDDYEELGEELKSLNTVIPGPDGTVVLIPRPFETGALFMEVPVRLLRYAEEQNGEQLVDAMMFMLANTFNFDPKPQLVAPPMRILMNSQWNGLPVVPRSLENVEPREQFQPWTPDTYKRIGATFDVSPLKLQALVEGYLGTIGTYGVAASDALMQPPDSAGEEVERRLSQWPLLRRFMREAPYTNTSFESRFYDMLDEVQTVVDTARKMRREARGDDLDDYLSDPERAALFAISAPATNTMELAADLNAQMRAIRSDDTLSGEEKLEQILELQEEQNALFRDAMEAFDEAMLEEARRALEAGPQ